MESDADFAVPSGGSPATSSGPVTDPVRSGKAKPKRGAAAKPASNDEPKVAPDDAEARRASEHPPVIHPTAADLEHVFRAQQKAAAEDALQRLAREHPIVAELLKERDALKAQLAAKG